MGSSETQRVVQWWGSQQALVSPVTSEWTWVLTSPLLPPSLIYSRDTLSCRNLRHWEAKWLCESHAENQEYSSLPGFLNIISWCATERPALFSKILGLPHWINKIILHCLLVCPICKQAGKNKFVLFYSEDASCTESHQVLFFTYVFPPVVGRLPRYFGKANIKFRKGMQVNWGVGTCTAAWQH